MLEISHDLMADKTMKDCVPFGGSNTNPFKDPGIYIYIYILYT